MRRWFVALFLVPGAIACSRSEGTSSSTSSSSTTLSSALAGNDSFDACVNELMGREEQAVKQRIERLYRLSPDDAHDVVRDALINVCVRHATRRYERLGASLQTAAENRARDGWRQRRRYPNCPLDDQMPSCSTADENVRLKSEDRAVEVALCKEDRFSERIIRQHLVEGMDYAEIGREHGLTADQVRGMYHNALRRVQKRVSTACDA